MTLPNAPPRSGRLQVCNAARASVSQFVLPTYALSYWKNPQTLSSNACIPVLETRTLTVTKTVRARRDWRCPPHSRSMSAAPMPIRTSTVRRRHSTSLPRFGKRSAYPVGSTCAVNESPAPAAPSGKRGLRQPGLDDHLSARRQRDHNHDNMP